MNPEESTAVVELLGDIAADTIFVHSKIAAAISSLPSAKLAQLREGLRRDGQQNAVDVALIDGALTVVDGHHRRALLIELGSDTVLAQIRRCITTLDQAIYFAVTQNLQRRQMAAAEDKALTQIVIELRRAGNSIRSIAMKVGVPPSTIADLVGQRSDGGQLTPPDQVVGRDGRVRPAKQHRGRSPRPKNRRPLALLAEADSKQMAVDVREEELEHAMWEADAARLVINEFIEVLGKRLQRRVGVEYPPRDGPGFIRHPSTDLVAGTVTTSVGKVAKRIEPPPRVGRPPEMGEED